MGKNLDIHRAAIIITSDAEISDDMFEKDVFVRLGEKVGLGGSRITHDRAALQTNLIYPGTGKGDKPVVDDGGIVYDDGKTLIIPSYFTSSTRPKLIQEEYLKEEPNIPDVKKEIRRKTGRVFSNITGRKVIVEHADDSQESFE